MAKIVRTNILPSSQPPPDHNIDVQLVFTWAPKLAKSVRVNIGCPVVRTDGGRSVAVRSRDYQIFWDG